MTLDPRIETIRVQYGLDKSDFWELPMKKGTWLAKHSALEAAAVKAGVRFDMPTIVEANGAEGVAAVCVQGEMSGRFEWSIGEASPRNTKNPYPYAMAEKRGKDRVILKLLGLHGLVYSEDEADDFKEPRNRPTELREQLEASVAEPPTDEPKSRLKYGTITVEAMRPLWTEMKNELDACPTLKDLGILWNSPAFKEELAKLSPSWRDQLTEHKDALKVDFGQRTNLGEYLDQMARAARAKALGEQP